MSSAWPKHDFSNHSLIAAILLILFYTSWRERSLLVRRWDFYEWSIFTFFMRCHFSRHGVISSVRQQKVYFSSSLLYRIEPILPLNHVFSFTATQVTLFLQKIPMCKMKGLCLRPSQRATEMNLIRINPLCKTPRVASFIDSPNYSEIQIQPLVAD